MNSKERIKNYMKTFGSISTMEAFMDLGITRLGARIMDLEREGVPIERKRESSVNRFGEKVNYMRYSIGE